MQALLKGRANAIQNSVLALEGLFYSATLCRVRGGESLEPQVSAILSTPKRNQACQSHLGPDQLPHSSCAPKIEAADAIRARSWARSMPR